VRDDALRERGIEPDSSEAKSLRFAGLRGMIASYIMGIVLITQKTDALGIIVLAAASITLFQIFVAHGGLKRREEAEKVPVAPPGTRTIEYEMGVQRAHAEAHSRGIVDATEELIESGMLSKFNVDPARIRQLISYEYNIPRELFRRNGQHHDDERIEEPNLQLEETYRTAYDMKEQIARRIEDYSHFGIFTFIHNYYLNWVS
ncbi:MAG: hypothetical protein KDE54_28230, partial [Caldilineaceae bacterium]|nr:hypothetical protein [Caldilineaceae bacterium]